MGPAAAWAVPAGLGLVGSIIGNNNANHAAQAQANAAQQATTGQNALNDQQIKLLNSMLADYQKNYQPLEGPMSAQMQQVLAAINSGQLDQNTIAALMSPGGRDNATGINLQQLLNNDLNYSSNPSQTLGGLNGIGGQALSGFMNPNTNLSRVTPGLEQYFGNPQNTALARMAPAALQYLNSPGNTLGRTLGQQNLDYFTNPQGTNLAGQTPGFVQSMQGPGQTGAAGADTMGYFKNLMQTGSVDPALIAQALQNQEKGFNRNISDILSKGDGLANRSGTVKDIAEGELGNKVDLLAQIAGQGQALRTQGAQGMLGSAQAVDQSQMQRGLAQLQASGQLDAQTAAYLQNALASGMQLDAQTMDMLHNAASMASGLDTQQAGMLSQLPGLAGGLDQQTYQRLGLGLNTAGGIDQQTLSMLNNAFGIGSGASQTQLGNMQAGQGVGRGSIQDVMNYIGQGRNIVPGVASGIGGIASQYGQAAGNAATNAASINQNTPNPFSGVASFFANNPGIFNRGGSGGGGGGFGGFTSGGSSYYPAGTNSPGSGL